MGKLPALLEALRDADVYYITATCKHFNTKGEFYVLLEFQLMMHDRLRAGLTCIKIFLELGAFDFQVNLLVIVGGTHYDFFRPKRNTSLKQKAIFLHPFQISPITNSFQQKR